MTLNPNFTSIEENIELRMNIITFPSLLSFFSVIVLIVFIFVHAGSRDTSRFDAASVLRIPRN